MGNGARVTIASVADAAGVSVPTVSKVVNGRADVAPDTRERVERVLRESGYKRRSPSRDDRLPEPMQLHVKRVELDRELATEMEAEIVKFLTELDEAVADLSQRYLKEAA